MPFGIKSVNDGRPLRLPIAIMHLATDTECLGA